MYRIAMVAVALTMMALVAGCGVHDQQGESELPNKKWQTDQYQEVENTYNSDEGNYAIAVIEAKDGEKLVSFSLGNDKPMTFIKRNDRAYRVFSSVVKYPGTSEMLEVREVYLMSRGKQIAYAYRKW